MVRHDRSPHEVLQRARLIGEVVLEDSNLPSSSLLDPEEVEAWAEAAAADPYREGALRFMLDGHDVLVRYRPASDRLTVSTPDSTPTLGTISEPGRGLTLVEAETKALECIDGLEGRGVLGHGEFARDYSYASERPTYVEGSSQASIGRYSFVFNPNLDGLPLLSTEVVISVNASSGRCERVTVSGQVSLERLGDARVELVDVELAKRLVEHEVAKDAPAPLLGVHVQGEIGYYLPLTRRSAKVSPLFVARYATRVGTSERPILSRGKFVGLPLVDVGNAGLVDLLGPGW